MAAYGLDLSSHNGSLVFGPIKNAGNSFAIIRAGYGWSVDQKDPMFDTYYKQAKAAGLKVGAYWYSYARNLGEARKEAECFLDAIKGKQFEMPVYIDMEDADNWKAQNGNPSGAIQAQIANAFMKIVQDAGYYVGIYSSSSWFDHYLLGLDGSYTRWVANWGNDDGSNHGGVSADMHQYTSNYIFGGKRFDRNICYKDFTSSIKANGLNGFSKSSGSSSAFDINKWMNDHNGAFIDIDGVYGYQCVDVFKQLCVDLGMADGTKAIGGDGYAHQIWYLFDANGYDKFFDKVPASDVQAGDVVVFGRGGDTPSSHVGICTKAPSDGMIGVFGQNQGGATIPGKLGSACNIVTISASSLLGGLRIKKAEPQSPRPEFKKQAEKYVYRMYNPNSGDHLYTMNFDEAKALYEIGWSNETGWISPSEGQDVYRMYDGKYHHFVFEDEAEALKRSGWKLEGFAFKSGGSKPVFRLYNPNDGNHVLTVERKEHDALSAAGWYCEGQDFRGN